MAGSVCFPAQLVPRGSRLPMNRLSLFRRGLAGLAAVLSIVSLRAEVSCARLFTDHMVLQRERPVPVWGQARAGERVIVEFAGQRLETTADVEGHWNVRLDPLATSVEPRTLVVRGDNRLEFRDVLVGEVWFCSGQSNMEKPIGERRGQKPTTDHDIELAAANYPHLRIFQVPRGDLKQTGPGVYRWLPTTPTALRDSDFSAVAYHFGRIVQQTLGVPVGLIHASFGGTRIEAWLPLDAFADPKLAGLEQERYPAWVPGVQPTELFNSMVKPYAPYAIRGFLWYQGENNCMVPDVELYAHKQTMLIARWRELWGIADAPFYGVLLAPFDYSKWEKFATTGAALPAFWEAQIAALSAPNTGYAVISDLVDNLHDIHPINKRGVGLRLARLALAETYGRKDIVAHGPTRAGIEFKGGAAEVSFVHATGLHTRDGLEPSHFAVAGADRVFHPAKAKIDGERVRVSSPVVNEPVAIRFAWDETAVPNLVNAAGIPAVPFRSDDWPLVVARPIPNPPELRP